MKEMRHYECKCLQCGNKKQIAFQETPYPEYGDIFFHECRVCMKSTEFTRVLTRKTAAELRKRAAEKELRQSIEEACEAFGFSCRFLYQSVIVTTPLSDWCFDYHESRITLYHESTYKINFETGNYAKAHVQFKDRKLTPLEVIRYIAGHEQWRIQHRSEKVCSNEKASKPHGNMTRKT